MYETPSPASRLPIIGVLGSGTEACEPQASRLGQWLAGRGVHLLTGGGGGVMEAVSRSFFHVRHRQGLVLGIIPGDVTDGRYCPRPGYPNPWVEVPVFTHLPLSGAQGMDRGSRNHINVLTAALVIALPGGLGTSSEIRLAVRYGRPVLAYVKRRTLIPELPPEVPATHVFASVARFIERHIRI
jgi:uncharacterized protein (TIGR00725 family)